MRFFAGVLFRFGLSWLANWLVGAHKEKIAERRGEERQAARINAATVKEAIRASEIDDTVRVLPDRQLDDELRRFERPSSPTRH